MSRPTPRRRSASRPAGPPDEHAGARDRTDLPQTDPPAADLSERSELAETGTIGGPYVTDVVEREDHRRRKRQRRRFGSPDQPDDESPAASPEESGEAAGDSTTGPSTGVAAGPSAPSDNPVVVPPAGNHRSNDSRRSDRGLRGLEASRSSQLSPNQAMRAREFARPTDDDLAEAEAELLVVRRNYVPPTPLQSSRRRGRRRDDGTTLED